MLELSPLSDDYVLDGQLPSGSDVQPASDVDVAYEQEMVLHFEDLDEATMTFNRMVENMIDSCSRSLDPIRQERGKIIQANRDHLVSLLVRNGTSGFLEEINNLPTAQKSGELEVA